MKGADVPYTFGELLESLEGDFSCTSVHANRVIGEYIANYAWSEGNRAGQQSVIDIDRMNGTFWGEYDSLDAGPLKTLMQKLHQPNGFDFTDVALRLLRQKDSSYVMVTYYPDRQLLELQ